MVIIIIWIFLSFIVAVAGDKKKIGYWGTFFLSLILSPLIGLIIALVSSDKGPQAPSPKKCKHCGFDDKIGSQFCPGCGKDNSGKTQEDYKKIAEDPEYQKKRKEELEIKNRKIEEKKKKESKIGWIVIVIITVVLIILVVWAKYQQ